MSNSGPLSEKTKMAVSLGVKPCVARAREKSSSTSRIDAQSGPVISSNWPPADAPAQLIEKLPRGIRGWRLPRRVAGPAVALLGGKPVVQQVLPLLLDQRAKRNNITRHADFHPIGNGLDATVTAQS